MNTTIDTVRELQWEGPLGIVMVLVIAGVLLSLVTWALMRERRILGDRHFVLFWCLRAMAVAAALWMLLAPSQVTTERTTTRQSLIIAADISDSMRTLDEPDTADDLRWSLASDELVDSSAIIAADRATVAAVVAEQSLRTVQQLQAQHQPQSEWVAKTKVAAQSLERVRTHLRIVADESRWSEAVQQLLQLLEDESLLDVAKADDAMQRGRDVSASWQDSLSDAVYNATSLSRRTSRLAQQVRQDQSEIIASERTRQLAALRQQPRLDRVASAIRTLANGHVTKEDSADIRYCAFDAAAIVLKDQAKPSDELQRIAGEKTTPDAASTDLATSLQQLQQSQRGGKLAAIILYSDTLHTAQTSPTTALQGFEGTPIYVVPIGNPRHVRDCAIQSVMAPSVVMKDDSVVIEADIQAYDCAGETCMVELVSDDVTIARKSIEIEEDIAGHRIRFDTKLNDLGRHSFEVRIAPIDGEQSTENNNESFEVNVTRGKIGVLVADQGPRWEFRYLVQLFRRDPKIEADELLFEPRLIATGARESSRAFPTTVDEWAKYDAVILGDVASDHFSPQSQASMIEYLRFRGGTVVMIAGTEFMPGAYANQPIESILPVSRIERESATSLRDGFSLQVTESGNRHHALMIGEDSRATQMAWEFINRNSPVGWLSPFRVPRPSATSLIAANSLRSRKSTVRSDDATDETFLCWQPIGRGRIVYLSGPETYRLRYLHGDRFHYRLWGQLLRWSVAADLSSGGEYVRLRTGKARYNENETISVSAEVTDTSGTPVLDASLSATVASDGQPPFVASMSADSMVPGRYVATLDGLPPGEYEFGVHGDAMQSLVDATGATETTTHFIVRPFVSRERLDTRCDLVMAEQLATATGGQVLPPTAVAEILELTDLSPIVTQQVQRSPLWIRWELLGLVVGCMSVEWVIRKYRGLS